MITLQTYKGITSYKMAATIRAFNFKCNETTYGFKYMTDQSINKLNIK